MWNDNGLIRPVLSRLELTSSDCPLVKLDLSCKVADNQAKTDLLPFIYALATNDTLKELNVSGNAMGDKGLQSTPNLGRSPSPASSLPLVLQVASPSARPYRPIARSNLLPGTATEPVTQVHPRSSLCPLLLKSHRRAVVLS